MAKLPDGWVTKLIGVILADVLKVAFYTAVVVWTCRLMRIDL